MEQLSLVQVVVGARVEVVRSAKRRKTVSAREVDGVIRVSIPATMTKADEAKWVDEMVRRLQRKSVSAGVDLAERAAVLAARYRLPRPDTIRWVGNMGSRWGSCTPVDRSIRISDRLADYPPWVLDYVLVHELAHIVHPQHTPAFWGTVERAMPDYERRKDDLTVAGAKLWLGGAG